MLMYADVYIGGTMSAVIGLLQACRDVPQMYSQLEVRYADVC